MYCRGEAQALSGVIYFGEVGEYITAKWRAWVCIIYQWFGISILLFLSVS